MKLLLYIIYSVHEKHTMDYLELLPDEIILDIYNYLDPESFSQMRLSCKRARCISKTATDLAIATLEKLQPTAEICESSIRAMMYSQIIGDGINRLKKMREMMEQSNF